MVKKHVILSRLKENFLFSVIRGDSAEEALDISEAVIKGGIKNIEITFTTPQADDVIRELAKKYGEDKETIIGAGTVMDSITARIAIISGAEFIVSPNYIPDVSNLCNLYGIPYFPGCATVNEIVEALSSGVEVVKVFPGGILGPKFIQNVHGPLPHVEMMPSGGVSLDNMEEWMQKGAWAVGIGSALTKKLESEGYSSVTEQALTFVQQYNKLK